MITLWRILICLTAAFGASMPWIGIDVAVSFAIGVFVFIAGLLMFARG